MPDYIPFPSLALPFFSSLITTAAAVGLLSIPLRRLPPDAHWSLAATKYWPVRTALTLVPVWFVTFAVMFPSVVQGVGRPMGAGWLILVSCLIIAGCLTGVRLGLLGVGIPESSKGGGLRALPARWLLFPVSPLTILVMLLTWRRGVDPQALITAAAALALLVLLHAGGSVALMKWLRILKPAPPDIQEAARRLAEAEGARLNSVWTMKLSMVNAFASVWTRDLILTDSAVRSLNREEVESVMAHETGHLKESRAACWRRMIILPGFMAMGLLPAAAIGGQYLMVIGLLAAYALLVRLAVRFHKRMETEADAVASRSQALEGTYARALEKIHAAGLIPAVLSPRHPYPSLYDRMISAGVTPDFPRPSPPSRLPGLLVAVVTVPAFIGLWRWLVRMADSPP